MGKFASARLPRRHAGRGDLRNPDSYHRRRGASIGAWRLVRPAPAGTTPREPAPSAAAHFINQNIAPATAATATRTTNTAPLSARQRAARLAPASLSAAPRATVRVPPRP